MMLASNPAASQELIKYSESLLLLGSSDAAVVLQGVRERPTLTSASLRHQLQALPSRLSDKRCLLSHVTLPLAEAAVPPPS